MNKENEMENKETQEKQMVKKYDWSGIEEYEKVSKLASMFYNSGLFPDHIKGKNIEEAKANMMIVADMSIRTGLPMMATAQNLYIVQGKPSWSSQFIITIINNAKDRFKGKLKFKTTGKGETLQCYAYTNDIDGEELIGPTITMEMARLEGWSTKNGSKWKTMPEVMIQYRAASFFGRMYCPDLLMGLYAEEEVQSIPEKIHKKEEAFDPFANAQVPDEIIDAEVVEDAD